MVAVGLYLGTEAPFTSFYNLLYNLINGKGKKPKQNKFDFIIFETFGNERFTVRSFFSFQNISKFKVG